MKITHIECWKQDFKLKEPYTIAYETIEQCTNVFIKVETNLGLTGWGCAAPDEKITGETGDTVIQLFRDKIESILIGSNPFTYNHLLREMKSAIGRGPSTLAMIDMALYDLVSKKAGVPLYQYLGGYRDKIATSVTIGILPFNDTIERAKIWVHQGFSILKIKGGINVLEDIEKVVKLRETLGNTIEIRFDANQGYTVEDSVLFTEKTRNVNIELLEQPSRIENESQLGVVKDKVSLPVMADESLKTLKDVFRLTSKDLIDMINIKLMKVGGINVASHINSVASSAGVEAMVGCLDESALAISAGLHFALATPNVIYVDLDSFLEIEHDPFPTAFDIKNGVLYPTSKPGLGI